MWRRLNRAGKAGFPSICWRNDKPQIDRWLAPAGSFFAAPKPMLDPRQIGEEHPKAEIIAARYKYENDAANRQAETNADDALAALEVTDDRFVSGGHSLSL